MQDRKAFRLTYISASPRSTVLALVVASAIASAPAHAFLRNYMRNTVVGSMTVAEANAFSEAAGKALADTADGDTMEWTSPNPGRRDPIHATITALESRTDRGQPCRRMTTELRRGTSEERWTGWFCKQADGEWKSRRVGG
ncbi:hypothetical protein K6V92_14900 [Cupriavidus respiraculi]|uniref:hypothetical protein n=1 Tax=Cupriavidus respiraculi TaxID=195930 RepID=UPI001C973DEF|nr:hypothetical protein [Cupriavidus respiraculi]MBY4947905.1 hypothetical protein [Cupriavidus respiraculi]